MRALVCIYIYSYISEYVYNYVSVYVCVGHSSVCIHQPSYLHEAVTALPIYAIAMYIQPPLPL